MLSVILKSSVRGLGKAGEIAKVRPGYARYLLADGKAVRATEDNLALLERKLSLIEEENSKRLAEARGVAEALASECLVMVRQSSDDGKLFGSVTVRDVSKLLCGLGYDVRPRDVFFGELIKRTGEYEISVELHADLVAVLKLNVVKNEAEAERVRLGVARSNQAANVEENVATDAQVEETEQQAAPDTGVVDEHDTGDASYVDNSAEGAGEDDPSLGES
ncbi:50S ribosomal protein L9 [Anaplasma capra]|uniref:50S ribosomal protein L9 n=1 Tax=Anaplasma capra TaxID=1562740 RepID=UPI0021D5DFB1|nr:50S ribosomal protein L9 [Anaplasma capra]MCU7612532.1 50S ribosomal protein L9 [Anaplasma capra]